MGTESSEARNSGLRKSLKFIPEAAARTVHKLVPDLTPNQITAASALATAVASTMAERKTRTSLVILGVAQALDFFDGSLAREIKRAGDRQHDSRWGGMWDSLNDRWGAGVMGVSRIVGAYRRGDKYGEFISTVTTLSNPIPSLMRACGESKGYIFPESGGNVLEFFGTHAGRTMLSIPATFYPRFYRLQNIADTISSVANITVAYKRATGGIPVELPEDRAALRADADFRGKALMFATIATAGAVLATHYFLHKNSSNTAR